MLSELVKASPRGFHGENRQVPDQARSSNTYVQSRHSKLRFLRLLYDVWDFTVLVLPSAAPADAYDRVSTIRVGWETAGG